MEDFIIISHSCIWFVCGRSVKRCVELFFYFVCTVPGTGFLGVPVWWQHGSEARNRLQDDSPAAEYPGAVGRMAGQCDDASSETLWREAQFSKSCQAVSAKMVFLQVPSQFSLSFIFHSLQICVCNVHTSQTKENK